MTARTPLPLSGGSWSGVGTTEKHTKNPTRLLEGLLSVLGDVPRDCVSLSNNRSNFEEIFLEWSERWTRRDREDLSLRFYYKPFPESSGEEAEGYHRP